MMDDVQGKRDDGQVADVIALGPGDQGKQEGEEKRGWEWARHMPDIHAHLVAADPMLERVLAGSTLDWDLFIKTPFVAVVSTVVGRVIRYTKARALRKRLYDRLGGVSFGPAEVEALLADARAIDAVGLSPSDVDTLGALCAHINEYGTPETADDVRLLGAKVRGIGPWVVDAALVTAMLDTDAFPACDAWLRRKMALLYGAPKALTVAEAKQRAAAWSPYRGVAAAYLWRWFDSNEIRHM